MQFDASKLATFTTTTEDGRDVLISASDVRRAHELPNGSMIVFWDGTTAKVQMTVADMQTAINALWDEAVV